MTKLNKPKAAPTRIDPAELSICADPIPEHRTVIGSKYDAVFSNLKPGQALKCPPGAAPGKLATSLRKFIEKRGMNCDIKTMSDYGDGFGRVWLIAKEAKLKRAA